MLVEMAANDLVAMNWQVDTVALRTGVIEFVKEGVAEQRQCRLLLAGPTNRTESELKATFA